MPRTHEELIANGERNLIFRANVPFGYGELTPGEKLKIYYAWLIEQAALVKGEYPGMPLDEITAIFIMLAVKDNQAFLEGLRNRNRQWYDSQLAPRLGEIDEAMQIPASQRRQLFRHYEIWVDDEIDDVLVASADLGVQGRLHRDTRLSLMEQFQQLMGEDLSLARAAGLNYQRQKVYLSEVMSDIVDYLKLTSGTLSVEDAKEKLKQESLRNLLIAAQYESLRPEMARLDSDPRSQAEFDEMLENQCRAAFEKSRMAHAYLVALNKAEDDLSGKYRIMGEQRERAATTFEQLNTSFRELNSQVIDEADGLRTDLGELEAAIARKKSQLESFIELIPRLHHRLGWITEKLKSIEGVGKWDGQREHLNIAKQHILEQIERANKQHEKVARELAFLDAKYNALFDTIDAEMTDEEELLALRDAAREELQWIKRLPKADKALNAYCSAFSFSLDFLLAIGAMVGDNLAESTGGRVATVALGAISGIASGNIAGAIVGGAGVGAALGSCRAVDTGSLSISLKLGLSFGVGDDWGAKIGLALVYNAGINIQDDRRFRATASLTVKAVAEAKIPKLFEAAIEADLMKDVTTLVFKDHYQWAAWLAQKWGNIKAWVSATTLYQRAGNPLDQPTPKDLRNMRELALISLANNRKLKDVFDRIAKFMEEPIVRVETREFLSGFSASASFADQMLGAGLEGERVSEPKFIKREYDSVRDRLHEVQKLGRQWYFGGNLSLLITVGVQFQRYSVHANPDNEGDYINVKVKYPGLTQGVDWIGGPDKEAAVNGFTEWIEANFSPIADALEPGKIGWLRGFSDAFSTNEFVEFKTSLSMGNVEFHFVKAEAGSGRQKESSWCLQYWRPIFSTETSINRSIPVYTGINVDIGGSIALSRTYREQIGKHTLTYVRTVYHGFMNRTEPNYAAPDSPRPEKAYGKTLWDNWADQHSKRLYALCYNVGQRGSWPGKEARGLTGGSTFVQACARLTESYSKSKFDRIKRALDTFLEGARIGDYKPSCGEGWTRVHESDFTWSINPMALFAEIKRARTSGYRLDRAMRTLGTQRRGLREQIARDRQSGSAPPTSEDRSHWIPDKEAPNCFACRKSFGVFTRRHHCRKCGGVFCNSCTKKKMAVPERGCRSPVRVCDACFALQAETGSVRQMDERTSGSSGSVERPRRNPFRRRGD